MGGRRQTCPRSTSLAELQAAELERSSAAAGRLAAGMQAEPAADSSAEPVLAAGIRPVLLDCPTFCREAEECLR